MKKKTIIFIIIIVLLVFLYFLNDAYGRILLKEALHYFPTVKTLLRQ